MTTDAEERILQLDRKVRANEHVRQVNEERRIHGEQWRRESFDEMVSNNAINMKGIMDAIADLSEVVSQLVEGE